MNVQAILSGSVEYHARRRLMDFLEQRKGYADDGDFHLVP